MTVGEKKELLSYLAARKFEQEQYVLFEQGELQGYIAEYLRISTEDSEAVLDAIEAQHGLLIERAQGFWSFSHLTFQEYFTAKRFVERIDWQGLTSHIADKYWREVFLLAVEMLQSADRLLKFMKQQVDKLVDANNKLQQFLTWVNQKSCSTEASYKPAAVRALYLALGFGSAYAFGFDFGFDIHSALTKAHSLTSAFAHNDDLDFELDFGRSDAYALELALDPFFARNNARSIAYSHECDLHLTIDPDLVLEPEVEQTLQQIKDKLPNPYSYEASHEAMFMRWWRDNGWSLTTQLGEVFDYLCNISHGWQFSNEQQKLLRQYYDANKLLVDCMNSSCVVSNEVRQEIEETLLLPITEIKQRQQQLQVTD